MPTKDAVRQCAEWLAECRRLGWRLADLDALEALWWKHHDERGELTPVAADGWAVTLPAVCTPEINAQIEAQIDHDKAIFEAGYVHGQQCAALDAASSSELDQIRALCVAAGWEDEGSTLGLVTGVVEEWRYERHAADGGAVSRPQHEKVEDAK